MIAAQADAGPPSRMADGIAQAVALQQQGRLDDAAQMLGAILAAEPDRLDALHLLGLLRHQQGRNGEALRLVGAVLQARAAFRRSAQQSRTYSPVARPSSGSVGKL